MTPAKTSSNPFQGALPARDHKHAPPQPAAGPAPRTWAGHDVKSLPSGPVIGVPDPYSTPEGAMASMELGASLLCLATLAGSVMALQDQGYLPSAGETPALVALGLITLTLVVRKERRLWALAEDEPRRVAAAGLSRKEQLERVVQRSNRHALSDDATRATIDSLRTAASLQSEDEPGHDRHITGVEVAQAIARLGRSAAMPWERMVPGRIKLLQEALMTLLQEGRIDVPQCAHALVLLAASVAAQLKENTAQGRPPSERVLLKVVGRLIAPFRTELRAPVPAWSALDRDRGWQCLLDVLQLPLFDATFGHFLAPVLAERSQARLPSCFNLLRRYTAHHIAATLAMLHGAPVEADGLAKADWKRLVTTLLGLVSTHPQRLEPSAVQYLGRLIALRARMDLPAADRQAARAYLRRLGQLLQPRINDALREALTEAWVLVLRATGGSEAQIAKDLAQIVPPAPPRPAPSQPLAPAVPEPGEPEQPGLMAPGLAQAIEQARAHAWADRGDRKGLNLEEQAALDARIARLKEKEAAAGPLQRGT